MKKSKEFKISVVLYVISIVVFVAAFVTGLFGNVYAIDKIGYFLGVAFMSAGTVFLINDQKKNNTEDSESKDNVE